MPREKATAVTPKAGYHDYIDENLKVVEVDYDNLRPTTEGDFKSRANLQEGVGGIKPIDTTFENYSEDIVDEPRSDWDDSVEIRGKPVSSSSVRHPAPHPIDLYRYPHRRT